jgi:hypothetical protein
MADEGNTIYGYHENSVSKFDIKLALQVIDHKAVDYGTLEVTYTSKDVKERSGKATRGIGLYLPNRSDMTLMDIITVKEFEGSPFRGQVVGVVSLAGKVVKLVKQVFEIFMHSPLTIESVFAVHSNDGTLLNLEKNELHTPPLSKPIFGLITFGAVAEKYPNAKEITVFSYVPEFFKRAYILVTPTKKDAELLTAIYSRDKEKLVEIIGKKRGPIASVVISERSGKKVSKPQTLKLV